MTLFEKWAICFAVDDLSFGQYNCMSVRRRIVLRFLSSELLRSSEFYNLIYNTICILFKIEVILFSNHVIKVRGVNTVRPSIVPAISEEHFAGQTIN